MRGMRRPVAVGMALVALCGLSGAGAAAATPAASAAAFVRVNQLGYPSAEAKRAYLMSALLPPARPSPSETRPAGRSPAGQVGADLGAWSNAFPHVYPIDFHVRAAGDLHDRGRRGDLAGVRRRKRRPPSTAGRWQTRAPSTRTSATARTSSARALRTAPGAPERRARDDLPDSRGRPNTDGFAGDLTPLGTRIDASGGWWDAGDYLKFVQTTSYTDAMLLAGVRDFPGQLGAAAAAPRTSRAEARSGRDWLLHMWDDRTRTLYYQVGIGDGNDHDHRRPRHLAPAPGRRPLRRRPTRADRYIRHRPVFRAGPPGSPISPNLAGRDAAALALCFQVFQTSRSALRGALPAGGGAHLRARRHHAQWRPADGDPVRLLSRDRVARRPRARRHRAGAGDRGTAGCPAICPTPARASTCAWRRTGRTPTSPARTTPPTRSTCTT